MDIVNRVLCETQQEYYVWAGKAARINDPATRPDPPTFEHILDAVTSYRTERLAKLPASWYSHIEPDRTSEPRSTDRPLRQQANSTPVFNVHADREHLQRFRECEYTNITAMMEGKEVTIPKHDGKNVCLVWALKGECSAGCKRKDQHARYSQATNRAIGQLLTKCGVAAYQA